MRRVPLKEPYLFDSIFQFRRIWKTASDPKQAPKLQFQVPKWPPGQRKMQQLAAPWLELLERWGLWTKQSAATRPNFTPTSADRKPQKP